MDSNKFGIHRRRNNRLGAYDYAKAGAYFVTICTQNRDCSLGEIGDNEMRLSETGQLVSNQWLGITQRFNGVSLDTFVVMPNHLHGIVLLDYVSAQCISPKSLMTHDLGAINRAPTLGEIMRTFKAVTTRLIRQRIDANFHWQRNYYEHVVRDEDSLARIRQYISNNPSQWALDRENPENSNRQIATYKDRSAQ